jgi:hypothetical protein
MTNSRTDVSNPNTGTLGLERQGETFKKLSRHGILLCICRKTRGGAAPVLTFCSMDVMLILVKNNL